MLTQESIDAQDTVYHSAFSLEGQTYSVTTNEAEHHGHISWNAVVTDHNGYEVLVMDYDLDEREWVSEFNGMFLVSSKQHPALAASTILSQYYVGA